MASLYDRYSEAFSVDSMDNSGDNIAQLVHKSMNNSEQVQWICGYQQLIHRSVALSQQEI